MDVTLTDQSHLDISVVQSLCVLIELNPYCEGELVVPQGAQRFEVKLVSILSHHFGLRQGNGNFSCRKVDICLRQ